MKMWTDRIKPVERRIVNVVRGTTFRIYGHLYKVMRVYSHHALCERDDGKKECFTVGDFVMMGMESVKPNALNCFKV